MTLPPIPVAPPPPPRERWPSGQRQPDRDLDNDLIALLRSHGPREGEALANYERLLEEVDDEAVRYLVRLVLDEERHHHGVIEQMLHTVQSFVWEVDVEPRVPQGHPRSDKALFEMTKQLLALERADAKELRHLRKALEQSHHYPVLALLVELMIHDAAKHVAILEFIRRRSKPV